MPDPMQEDHTETAEDRASRNLKTFLREVKSRKADLDDQTHERRTSELWRLELLASELRPLMEQVDPMDHRFDFGLSKGERSRLWIDMTSFVAMGYEGKTYRFIKDTLGGRTVLFELDEVAEAADRVAEYVAERVLDRERLMEGEWLSLRGQGVPGVPKATSPVDSAPGLQTQPGEHADAAAAQTSSPSSRLAMLGHMAPLASGATGVSKDPVPLSPSAPQSALQSQPFQPAPGQPEQALQMAMPSSGDTATQPPAPSKAGGRSDGIWWLMLCAMIALTVMAAVYFGLVPKAL